MTSERGRTGARLPYLAQEDLAEADRDVLERDINLFRILAHSPVAARRFNAVGHFIRYESELAPRLRQLAILQVGYLTRSAYEYSHHIKISRDFGLTDDEIRAIELENKNLPSCLDPLARNVIAAARELTVEGDLSDELFTRLRSALGEKVLIELLVTISFYNAVDLMLTALRIDVEPEYEAYLRAFPLPLD